MKSTGIRLVAVWLLFALPIIVLAGCAEQPATTEATPAETGPTGPYTCQLLDCAVPPADNTTVTFTPTTTTNTTITTPVDDTFQED